MKMASKVLLLKAFLK